MKANLKDENVIIIFSDLREKGGTALPMYNILKGREDGRRSKLEDTFNLQARTLNASQLIRIFGHQGFYLEKKCLGVVSCADVLAMVVRAPMYDISKGRKGWKKDKT
ncbi:hypothetical protein MTR_6g071100 [Medicago truncatula]|uniref:Peroxidase n=1 Tax=Medicago truncatula TaxID=3880 RepID=G7KQA9_MEDTR|nr:hypothetical protein MTR_6g071100 [Medicago truncatula]